MLARQAPLLDPLPTTLTPLLRHSCKLFSAPKIANSFAIRQIHTLLANHPGYGYLCTRVTDHRSPVTSHVWICPHTDHGPQVTSHVRQPSIFIGIVFIKLQTPPRATPLFTHLYKTPGGGGPPRPSDVPTFQRSDLQTFRRLRPSRILSATAVPRSYCAKRLSSTPLPQTHQLRVRALPLSQPGR